MIRTRLENGVVVLEGDLEDESLCAYIDADWVSGASDGELEPLVVEPGGAIRLGAGTCEGPSGVEPDLTALMALTSRASVAVAAARTQGFGPTWVTGRGVVAAEVRRILGSEASQDTASPRAAIDTTGEPSVIVEATRRLGDGGVLVLAGRRLGRRVDVNLYPDVHARGLHLVGVPPLPTGQLRGEEGPGDWHQHRQALATTALGQPIPSAPWYRIEP